MSRTSGVTRRLAGLSPPGETSLRDRIGFLAPSILAGVVVMGLLLSLQWLVERQAMNARLQSDLDALAQIRTRIESQLNQASNVSDGIAAMIEVERGLDEAEVRAVAERLLDRTPVIQSIAIAPDGVVRLSIPLEGNEEAIGVDLAAHPRQSRSLQRAIETGKSVLGGPYELVQGGYAVIHRVPVFIERGDDGDREYWGVVSTPIDVMRLFEAAEAGDLVREGRLAVRGFDGLGEDGSVFLGRPERFESPASLMTSVVALDGQWKLALRPSEPSKAVIWSGRVARLGSVLLGLLVIWLVLRWQIQQRRLVASERLLRDVNSHVNDVVFRADPLGRLVYLNPAYERLTGRSGRHLLGASWLNLFSEAEHRRVRLAYKRSRDTGRRLVMTSRLVRQNAASLPVEVRVDTVDAGDGPDAGLVGILSDQSGRHAYEQLEELATAVFKGSGDAIVILDRRRRVLAVNPAFERLVGMSAAELSGRRLRVPEAISPTRDWLGQVARHIRYRDRWQEEVASRLPDGSRRVLNWSLDAVRDERGRVTRYVAVITDVTRRHLRMEAMHHRAHHDPLTDLLNRAGLEERFEQARLHALREGEGIALAFIDLNDFKPINDIHGHHVGDEVLREIGSRLRAIGRREDIVARLGGDEFVVVFYGVRSPEATAALGETLRERIESPIVLHGMDHPLHVRASIGFARLSIDADSLDGLLRHADKAMYEAKPGKRGRVGAPAMARPGDASD